MEGNKKIWILVVTILAVAFVAVLIWGVTKISNKNKEIEIIKELSAIDMEEWNNELNALTIQYEGFQQTLSNDSLLHQLDLEKMRVQRLQEELKTVRATDLKRIQELEREIKTLRNIMYGYIVQIDSLNRINEKLVQENQQVRRQHQQATQTITQLTQEKEQLIETVQIASKLVASNISMRGLNKKNKEKKKIKDLARMEFQFTINENITVEPGMKTIYLRIMKPDEDVLTKSPGNVFPFEGRNITYSAKRDIEYTGQEHRMNIYWEIEETLLPGSYRVDIFADGNLIGKQIFILEK